MIYIVSMELISKSTHHHLYKQKTPRMFGWIDSRSKQTLNGTWHYIVDPMDNGLPGSIFVGLLYARLCTPDYILTY